MRKVIALIVLTICYGACSTIRNGDENNDVRSTSPSSNNVINSVPITDAKNFYDNLPADFVQPTDDIGRRMFKEYGAMFVSRASAPKTVIFKNDGEVTQFQTSVPSSHETIGGIDIELQTTAMKALKDAVVEAEQDNLTITPRGEDAAKRSYMTTVTLWASRVDPGLDHWVSKGSLLPDDAQRIRSLTPYEQVREIFKLESRGIYFSKDLQKSIIYSVAPPGTSQHLSMLALDVEEFENAQVRTILAKHGWYQTVVSDLPHFTYLGAQESELTRLGLKKVTNSGRAFWVPDL